VSGVPWHVLRRDSIGPKLSYTTLRLPIRINFSTNQVGSAEDGKQGEQHHYDNIHAQAPQQDADSEGQLARAKMSTPLRCDQLVRFKQ